MRNKSTLQASRSRKSSSIKNSAPNKSSLVFWDSLTVILAVCVFLRLVRCGFWRKVGGGTWRWVEEGFLREVVRGKLLFLILVRMPMSEELVSWWFLVAW